MKNEEFIKGLSVFCGATTVVLIIYAVTIQLGAFIDLTCEEGDKVLNPWVSWTAFLALAAAWLMSWVTSSLCETAEG